MAENLAEKNATELVDLFRGKQASPVEAVRAALARVEARDGILNAFRLVDAARALASAEESERRWLKGAPIGLLDGVPVSVKDVFPTKGWSTLYGSRLVSADQPWNEDAPAVARLKEAGAVLIGKTTTPEFHWKTVTDSPLTGVTRNPWNPALTPGGSCGGAAVAVATGMGALALGTDGGGSIRVPSAFTGVFGLKPSFGRVPLWPAGAFGTMAHAGPMTRSVADAALMLNVIALPDARDRHALPYDAVDYRGGLDDGVENARVAYSRDLGYAAVDPEVAAAVDQAARAFAGFGAVVEETSPGFADPRAIFETLAFAAIAHELSRFDAGQRALMDPGLVAVAEIGARVTRDDLLAAERAREEIGIRMRRFHEAYDLLITPTVPIPPFAAGRDVPDPARQSRWTEWSPFTYPFNMTGQPAASIPCGFTKAGLPVGLQIVGPAYGDRLVLRAARAFERADPIRLPPVGKIDTARTGLG
ncbi:MAG: amidase [Rhodospirillales bacterium]|nr:amidase [Rhodospirillales bacterium]